MGILDAYQDSTDTALRVMATQPLTPEPVTPKHSTWSAPFRAVAAGAAEVAGNVMDTAGAFGQVAAASGGLTPGFDPDAKKNRNATVEAFDKLKTEGINWRTDEAQQAYKFGSDLRPDPLTAGTAENLVFSLTKGLTKAIGAAVALGPVGGAAAFGASEGMTTAEDLANQGVDQATRTKVGAVTAGFNAAGVLLPVAGKTLAQTAGLVLAGGPASFMAQQAATREILRNADYKTIAEQYDPLDPVGLTVATLLPAGFAAYAKRGGFGAKQKPYAAPVSDTAPDSNVIAATPEAVDAAMVQNLTVARDVHEEIIQETKAAVEKLASIRVFHGTKANKDLVPTALHLSKSEDLGPHFTVAKETAQLFANDGGTPGRVIEADVFFRKMLDMEDQAGWHPSMVASELEKLGVAPSGFGADYFDIHDAAVREVWKKYPELDKYRGEWNNPPEIEAKLDAVETEASSIAADAGNKFLREFLVNQGYDAIRYKNEYEGQPVDTFIALNMDAVAEPGGNPAWLSKSANADNAMMSNADTQTPDAYAARVNAIAKDQPDLIARLDDAGQPVKLSDELAAIKKQAQEGTDTDFGALDAPLLKTALECALSLGAA